jgi:uncharacterized protein (TIGR00369 family)
MSLAALDELNRAIREKRVAEVTRVLGREPGMRAVELDRGVSRWAWTPEDERARNPFGLVWGGYLAVFVDALLSSAIGGVLDPGELATTADLRLDFLRPAKFAGLRGEGRVVQKGSRVAFVEATVTTEGGEALVRASSTWTVLRA